MAASAKPSIAGFEGADRELPTHIVWRMFDLGAFFYCIAVILSRGNLWSETSQGTLAQVPWKSGPDIGAAVVFVVTLMLHVSFVMWYYFYAEREMEGENKFRTHTDSAKSRFLRRMIAVSIGYWLFFMITQTSTVTCAGAAMAIYETWPQVLNTSNCAVEITWASDVMYDSGSGYQAIVACSLAAWLAAMLWAMGLYVAAYRHGSTKKFVSALGGAWLLALASVAVLNGPWMNNAGNTAFKAFQTTIENQFPIGTAVCLTLSGIFTILFRYGQAPVGAKSFALFDMFTTVADVATNKPREKTATSRLFL